MLPQAAFEFLGLLIVSMNLCEGVWWKRLTIRDLSIKLGFYLILVPESCCNLLEKGEMD
jgi:hypothetical protein